MARRDKPDFRDADGEMGDFVPAVFARSLEEAEDYRQLLDDHDIPAIIGDEGPSADAEGKPAPRAGFSHGLPVLVPEALLDEAGEVIAERDETDAFGLVEDDDEEEDEEFTLDETGPDALATPLGDQDDEEDDEEESDEDDKDKGLGEEDLFGEEDDDDDDDDQKP